MAQAEKNITIMAVIFKPLTFDCPKVALYQLPPLKTIPKGKRDGSSHLRAGTVTVTPTAKALLNAKNATSLHSPYFVLILASMSGLGYTCKVLTLLCI